MSNDLRMLLPYLQPIEHLLLDEGISEIMVNPDGGVFVERDGLVEEQDICYPSSELQPAVVRIARAMDQDVDSKRPLFQGRLEDGSRVAIVVPPCSVGGITLDIRKFVYRALDLAKLLELGTLTAAQADVLAACVQERQTILVCGQTGAGKTTLLNALGDGIPVSERIVVIEDVNELRLGHKNAVYLEVRPADPLMGAAAVSIADLLHTALRLRPDRIIIGEVRGGEAFDLLQALNTGHQGSLATIHANSCEMALTRLRACVAMAGVDLAPATFAEMIAGLIGLVVFIRRDRARRVVAAMARVEGYDLRNDKYRLTAACGH